MRMCFSVAALAAVAGLAASSALASVPIYGGPSYNSTTSTGYQSPYLPVTPGSTAGNGTAVGSANKYSAGTDLGPRAIRWDASGSPATELDTLGTDTSGVAFSYAIAINSAGTAVGYANKVSGGTDLGNRAVRWDASGTSATELGHLGTDSSGITGSIAIAISTAGTAVGSAGKYSGNSYRGTRAVRWDATGTLATELGSLGTDGSGFSNSQAHAINTAGTAVGSAERYSGGIWRGFRAVRWDASGTVATELGNLGTNSSGISTSQAYAISSAGTAVGFAYKYSGGVSYGERAVRWAASGTSATELGHLGTDATGGTFCQALAVNTAGTVVGYAYKYSGGTYLGERAVRWDASGTSATELGNLGTDGSGATNSRALAINTTGTAVGHATMYSDGTYLGDRAVVWGLDGVAIDLNTLLSPADASHWTLLDASGISDANSITGIGTFDPDGAAGPLAGYHRAFLVQLSTASILCDIADFDNTNVVSVNDLFAFLAAWFAQNGQTSPGLSADIDASGSVSVNDLFTYLALWFEYNGTSC